MICKSCSAEIPPQWLFALTANSCPGCGSELMNSDEKSLLDELTAAMEKMPNNPRGLAGWILSNFRVLKINSSIEPTAVFYTKNGGGNSNTNNTNNTNQVNDFQKRAQYKGPSGKIAEVIANKAGSNSKIAELAAAISQTTDPYESNETQQHEQQFEEGPSEEDVRAKAELEKAGFSDMFMDGISTMSNKSQPMRSEADDYNHTEISAPVAAAVSILEHDMMVTLPNGEKMTKEEANYMQSMAQNRPGDFQIMMNKIRDSQNAFDGGRKIRSSIH
jgi:hypothetical protein